MRTFRQAHIAIVVGALMTLVLSAGCSKANDGASVGTTAPGTIAAAQVADPASAGGTKAACDPAVLVPVIQQKYGQAGVDHLVCLAPYAILTVKTGGDDTVAFLVQKNGAWAIGADGSTNDAAKLLPTNFPGSLLRAWQDKRSPVTPTPSTAPPASQSRPTTATTACIEGVGDIPCPPPTTAAPASTTSKTPTTPAPSTTQAPVPTTPAPPTTFSAFCLQNPLDPSCSGKK